MKQSGWLETVLVILGVLGPGCSVRYAHVPHVEPVSLESELNRGDYELLGDVKGESCATYVGLWPIPLWFVTSNEGSKLYGVGTRQKAEEEAAFQAIDTSADADAFIHPRVYVREVSGGIWFSKTCVVIKGKGIRMKTDEELASGSPKKVESKAKDDTAAPAAPAPAAPAPAAPAPEPRPPHKAAPPVAPVLSKDPTTLGQACTRKEAPACFKLGVMYGSGDGVAKSKVRSAAYFKLACEAGSATGCYNLGVMYEEGCCGRGNQAKAPALLKRACELGDKDACE